MKMGDRIKDRRQALHYTQEQLAEKLGLQKSAIAKYVNGRVENIKRSVISKMAEVLECSPCYILGFTDNLETECIEKDDYKTLKMIFQKFGYNLQPYNSHGTYTLQHNKQKEFIIILSTDDLNTMLYDISDYISVLISQRVEEMINNVRTNSTIEKFPDKKEIKAAHNDYEDDPEEQEKMKSDMNALKRPE